MARDPQEPNWCGMLNEVSQQRGQVTPVYTLTGAIGPSHSPQFWVSVTYHDLSTGDEFTAVGTGTSLRRARQRAAQRALHGLIPPPPQLERFR